MEVNCIIGLFVKFVKTQKKESHNSGVLFFYTIDFSHRFERRVFSPWQTGVSETADNMHYVNLDWSTLKIDL